MFTKLKERVFGSDREKLNLSYFEKQSKFGIFFDQANMIRSRIPYWIEEKIGFDMRYQIMLYVPNNLLTSDIRELIKGNKIEDIKTQYYLGQIILDDPIDVYSSHTLLHDAVILNRVEIFDFLLASGANLNIRD